MAYNISKSSAKELQRAVNKFNAKIKRLEKVDREIDIPEKESIKAIKDRVTSKWDLNREINRLERFTKRNAEELIQNESGVVMSRWEFENLQREQRRLSARLERQVKRYGSTTPEEFGKSEEFTYAQMGDDRYINLKARQQLISRKNVMKLNIKQLKDFKSLLKKTSSYYDPKKKEIFYDNFLDGTLVNAGYFIGYDKNKLDYIRDKLHELTPTQFEKAFNKELSLRYIKERIDSPISKHDNITPEQLSEDLTPALDMLYENINQIVDSYK